MTKRRRFTKAEKAAIAAKSDGKCIDCGAQAKLEEEHEIPLWLGGKDEIENVVLRCPKCHKPKTRREAGQRAKIKRINLKRDGGYGHKRKFVKKIGGKVARNPNAKEPMPW